MNALEVRLVRSLFKAVEDVNRRLAAMHMTGRVAEKNGNLVRLELGPPAQSGKKFLSPWVQVQDAAGSTGTHTPVEIGDPMRLLSPDGELGPQSVAIRDTHTEDKPNPAGDPDELAIVHAGCELRMSDEGLLLKKGDTMFRLTGAGIFEDAQERRTHGAIMAHNSANIGDTHKHSGVFAGDALTQTPTPI